MSFVRPDPAPIDYETAFLRILNNEGKRHKGAGAVIRRRGFVALVRGATNLKPLQKLCFDPRQSYNHCWTARYRLRPEFPIGTLIAAFISDLEKLADNKKDLAGDLLPALTEDSWEKLEQLISREGDRAVDTVSYAARPSGIGTHPTPQPRHRLVSFIAERGSQEKQGSIDQNQVKIILDLFGGEAFETGERLVLFGELSEQSTNPDEWRAAMELVFTRLPERVGLVLSGAPKDFALPRDDPHFLEIELPKEDEAQATDQPEFAYTYTDSSFHKDEPASKDELGVNDYANAIARFLVHKQTRPPLTIGIHGPWGKGKSSFMKLVDNALVKYVDVNRTEKRSELNGETRLQRWNDLVGKLIQAESTMPAAAAGSSEEQEYLQNAKAQDELWRTMQREARQEILSVTFNAWQFEDAKQTWRAPAT